MPVARRPVKSLLPALVLAASGCGDGSAGDGGCTPPDADGVIGGKYTFVVTADDTGFTPAILKAQNTAEVTLTMENRGSTPHSLAIDCVPTPNEDGCPTTSCFPEIARLGPVVPGETAQATFAVPRVEGIYEIRSDVPGDPHSGQFIVQ